MSQNSPWSVKNVTPEARDAVKQAARKAGLTIGEWLSQAILAVAGNETYETPSGATNGEGGAVAPEGGSAALPSAPLPTGTVGKILELRGGYADLEERIYDTLEPLTQRVRRLSTQITELQYTSGKTEELSSLQDKVRELQRNQYDPGAVRNLQDQIREIKQQAQIDGNAQDLENRLYVLTKRVENMGGDGSPEQYEELSEMIKQIKQTSQQQITEQTAKLNNLSREIEQVRSESGSSVVSTGPMERALSRLAERLQKLEDGQPESKGGLFG